MEWGLLPPTDRPTDAHLYDTTHDWLVGTEGAFVGKGKKGKGGSKGFDDEVDPEELEVCIMINGGIIGGMDG